MLKNTIALALSATVGTAPAFSAVSGYWSSSKVLHAILGDNRVADALRQQPIEAISKTDSGYRVESRDCAVDVEVIVRQANHPGPDQFSIHIGEAKC